MTKMTRKYRAALEAAFQLKIPQKGTERDLYDRLSRAGLIWDSRIGEWIDPRAKTPEMQMFGKIEG